MEGIVHRIHVEIVQMNHANKNHTEDDVLDLGAGPLVGFFLCFVLLDVLIIVFCFVVRLLVAATGTVDANGDDMLTFNGDDKLRYDGKNF